MAFSGGRCGICTSYWAALCNTFGKVCCGSWRLMGVGVVFAHSIGLLNVALLVGFDVVGGV